MLGRDLWVIPSMICDFVPGQSLFLLYLTNFTFLQVDGTGDATSVAGSHPGMEQKEEPFDPMNIPDVDK